MPLVQKNPPLLRQLGTPVSVKAPVPRWTQVPANPNEHHRLSSSPGPDVLHLPPDIDPDVFKHLPESIQLELLSSFQAGEHGGRQGTISQSVTAMPYNQKLPNQQTEPALQQSCMTAHSVGSGDGGESVKRTTDCPFFSTHKEGLSMSKDQPEGTSRSSDTHCPSNVDPMVFAELPPELRQELLSEWKQQQPLLKIPSKKVGRTASTKEKKATTKAGQANNLLNYFKSNWSI